MNEHNKIVDTIGKHNRVNQNQNFKRKIVVDDEFLEVIESVSNEES